jgi:hypothetical protein
MDSDEEEDEARASKGVDTTAVFREAVARTRFCAATVVVAFVAWESTARRQTLIAERIFNVCGSMGGKLLN